MNSYCLRVFRGECSLEGAHQSSMPVVNTSLDDFGKETYVLSEFFSDFQVPSRRGYVRGRKGGLFKGKPKGSQPHLLSSWQGSGIKSCPAKPGPRGFNAVRALPNTGSPNLGVPHQFGGLKQNAEIFVEHPFPTCGQVTSPDAHGRQ